LAGIEGNADQKPGETGGNACHLPGDCIFDDRPEEGAVLQVSILLDSLSQEGSASRRKAQALLSGAAL
jgi:hypothetical protein